MNIEVGSIIKSLDFPHLTDCYMIGRVASYENGVIECETIKQVSEGKELPISEFNKVFRTTEPGTHFMDQMFKEPRIQVVG